MISSAYSRLWTQTATSSALLPNYESSLSLKRNTLTNCTPIPCIWTLQWVHFTSLTDCTPIPCLWTLQSVHFPSLTNCTPIQCLWNLQWVHFTSPHWVHSNHSVMAFWTPKASYTKDQTATTLLAWTPINQTSRGSGLVFCVRLLGVNHKWQISSITPQTLAQHHWLICVCLCIWLLPLDCHCTQDTVGWS